MHPENRENTIEGFQDETEKRKKSVIAFLQPLMGNFEASQKYDSLDLQVSSPVSETVKQIRSGDSSIVSRIDVLYKNNEIKIIHISFEGIKGNMDIHLTKKALGDYLAGI